VNVLVSEPHRFIFTRLKPGLKEELLAAAYKYFEDKDLYSVYDAARATATKKLDGFWIEQAEPFLVAFRDSRASVEGELISDAMPALLPKIAKVFGDKNRKRKG
jgi:hypothetical protein